MRSIKFRRLKGAAHVARMEESSSAFNILTDMPIGSSRRRWENIRMDVKEIRVNAGNWIDLVEDTNYCRVS